MRAYGSVRERLAGLAGFGLAGFGLDCQKASELVFWAWAGLRAGLGWACGVWAGLAGLRLSGCLPKWLAVAGFGLWAWFFWT